MEFAQKFSLFEDFRPIRLLSAGKTSIVWSSNLEGTIKGGSIDARFSDDRRAFEKKT